MYEIAIPAQIIARAVAYALEQPADVDINETYCRLQGSHHKQRLGSIYPP